MTSNVHQLPCGRSEHEDYGCIDCGDYPCMLWKAAKGEMRLPGEISRVRWGNAIIIRMSLHKEEKE